MTTAKALSGRDSDFSVYLFTDDEILVVPIISRLAFLALIMALSVPVYVLTNRVGGFLPTGMGAVMAYLLVRLLAHRKRRRLFSLPLQSIASMRSVRRIALSDVSAVTSEGRTYRLRAGKKVLRASVEREGLESSRTLFASRVGERLRVYPGVTLGTKLRLAMETLYRRRILSSLAIAGGSDDPRRLRPRPGPPSILVSCVRPLGWYAPPP